MILNPPTFYILFVHTERVNSLQRRNMLPIAGPKAPPKLKAKLRERQVESRAARSVTADSRVINWDRNPKWKVKIERWLLNEKYGNNFVEKMHFKLLHVIAGHLSLFHHI